MMLVGEQTGEEGSAEGPLEMTNEQIEILDYLLTHNWQETAHHFQIASHGALQTCVLRTAFGYHWSTGTSKGGRLHYLLFEGEQRLREFLTANAEDHQRCTLGDVVELAKLLKQEQLMEARTSLMKRRCPKLAEKATIESIEPLLGWVRGFIER